jgi:cell division transport system permease protein
MFFLSLFRVIKFSLQDLSRNIWLSIVTIIILILALFSINMLLVVKVIGEAAVGAIKDKIDISLYLKPDAPEDAITALKVQLEKLSDVKSVKYVSKEEALGIFQQNNSDNPEILQALRELGKNPLTPTLIIQPKNADAISDLTHQLDRVDSKIVDSRNFTDYQNMLNKINAVTDKVTEAGLILSAIFVFITLMVIFNAIRVAIYTHNMEINIMRLVGASNTFIYMPFLISGIFYTLFGLVTIILLFYPFLSLLQPYLEAFFVGYNINIVDYFNQHFWEIFGGEFLGIAAINVLASWWAVRRYAQV